jgi:hypothetical protein
MKHLISLLSIIALITGCHSPTNERVFMRQSAAKSPKTEAVLYNGQYRLYSDTKSDPSTQNATPLLEARLAKGDLLGFTKTEAGNLLAVIGSEQKPISAAASTSFTWTMQPDAGQYDPDRTAALILTVIVAGTAIGIGLASTVPFSPFY